MTNIGGGGGGGGFFLFIEWEMIVDGGLFQWLRNDFSFRPLNKELVLIWMLNLEQL